MSALPLRCLAGALAVMALLACTWWKGDQHGKATIQHEWDQEKADRAEQLREDAVNARKASVNYQADLAKLNARSVNLKKELVNALAQPIPTCPATVGAVVVPAAAINSLRDAGADPSP